LSVKLLTNNLEIEVRAWWVLCGQVAVSLYKGMDSMISIVIICLLLVIVALVAVFAVLEVRVCLSVCYTVVTCEI